MTEYRIEASIDLESGAITGTIVPLIEPNQPIVEPPEPEDPFVIRADEWTAVHDVARGPGHRRVEIDADVPAPAGHAIKLYSGTDPAGRATAKSATIEPGLPYETKNPLALGAVCYNSLWWLRADDGAISAASENVVSFPITGD